MNLFKDKKVVVMGLGLHGGGVGVAKYMCKQGAHVLVTDLKTRQELKQSLDKLKGLKIEYVLGRHREQDFVDSDLVIKNPDVPSDSSFLKVAKKNSVKIETDISIFFRLSRAYIIGITGSKGKSTTASLVYKLIKSRYERTFLAGNIGVSPLELLPKIKKNDRIVLELSSFELEDMEKSPQVALVTNIFPEHLNRYKGMKEYIEAKKKIFKFQGKKNILVLNNDDSIVKEFSSKARTYLYSFKKPLKNQACFLKGDQVFFGKQKNPILNIKDFKLFGDHNISNLLGAISIAKLLDIPVKNIEKTVRQFKGVPYRQEFIKESRGVKYFNDTTATMPQAVEKAIQAFSMRFPESNLILIAGGQDKKLDYSGMAQDIKKNVGVLILLPGTGTDKLKRELKGFKYINVDSLKQAVEKVSKIAQEGDIVILSPGGASFNLFKNEFDRGDQFNNLVKSLK